VGFFVLVLLLETRASLSAQVCFFATIPYERSENRLKASAYALRIFQYVETIRFLSPLLGAGALPSPQTTSVFCTNHHVMQQAGLPLPKRRSSHSPFAAWGSTSHDPLSTSH
jgi:hypothetical protein